MTPEANDSNLIILIDGLDRGGAELYVSWLMPSIVGQFSSVDVYTLSRQLPLRAQIEALGVAVRPIKAPILFLELVRCSRPVYVHLAKASLIAMWAAAVGRLLGRNLSITLHEHAAPQYHQGRKGIFTRVKDMVFRAALDYSLRHGTVNYVVPTVGRLADLRRSYPKNRRIFAVQNSLPGRRIGELGAFRRERVDKGLLPHIGLCTFSRLHPGKQIAWAIDAAAAVADHFDAHSVKLSIAGEGAERETLARLASKAVEKRSNLEVNFLGFRDGIESLARDHQFFLLPSLNEGFGLGLLEAALVGMDCISNDCPFGPRDMAEKMPNIVLVAPTTREAFVAKVVQCVHDRRSWPCRVDELSWPSLEEQAKAVMKILALTAPGSRSVVSLE